MRNEYRGPLAREVPLGWFKDAAAVAARASPEIAFTIRLTEDGFMVTGRMDDRTEPDLLSFFDLAMEEDDNPFLTTISQIADKLRA